LFQRSSLEASTGGLKIDNGLDLLNTSANNSQLARVMRRAGLGEQLTADEQFQFRLRMMAGAKGKILPAERFGKQKTSWRVVTVIFFLALLSPSKLRYANEESIWWIRVWNDAGPVLVWVTVALTIYSGLLYAWRHRDLIVPNE
jgi:hypothetical protein